MNGMLNNICPAIDGHAHLLQRDTQLSPSGISFSIVVKQLSEFSHVDGRNACAEKISNQQLPAERRKGLRIFTKLLKKDRYLLVELRMLPDGFDDPGVLLIFTHARESSMAVRS